MDACIQAVLQSAGACAHKSARLKENDRAMLYRKINSSVLGFLSGSGDEYRKLTGPQKVACVRSMVLENVQQLLSDFMWLTRCCNNATEIADTFNSMHLAGIVVCKAFFVLCKYHNQRAELNVGTVTLPRLFPLFPAMHVSPKTIMTLSYLELVHVLTSLQEQWSVLVVMDVSCAGKALVACMVRFCVLYCLQLSSTELDDTQEREKVLTGTRVGEEHSDLYVMSKRATRHFITTFVCMLREMVLHTTSVSVEVVSSTPEDKARCIDHEVVRFGQTLPPGISHQIRGCFAKIKSIRNAGLSAPADAAPVPPANPASPTHATPADAHLSDDVLWAFLVKKIGPHKMGPCPRKISPEYSKLLADTVVALSSANSKHAMQVSFLAGKIIGLMVTRSCLNVVQTALKFFYVVPSADRFREISLIENLCSGQRLNYAFDFMHFDTGQLSQVVYLHNLQYKQTTPPNTVQDWKDSSVAGPIAAFLQLITDLEIWLHDADDPLGILGDRTQIRRPMDRSKDATPDPASTPDDTEASATEHRQVYNAKWGIVVNKTDAYLVNRATAILYKAEVQRTFPEFHRVLPILVIYLRQNNLMESIACVALNALKISSSL